LVHDFVFWCFVFLIWIGFFDWLFFGLIILFVFALVGWLLDRVRTM